MNPSLQPATPDKGEISSGGMHDGIGLMGPHSPRTLLPSMSGLTASEPAASTDRTSQSSSTIALVSFKREDEFKPQQRRRRRNLTPEETAALENAFAQSNYLTASMRDDLMAKTNLSLAKLYKWFDNRRSKKRVLTTTVGGTGGTIPPSSSGTLSTSGVLATSTITHSMSGGAPATPAPVSISLSHSQGQPHQLHQHSILSSSSGSNPPPPVQPSPSAPSMMLSSIPSRDSQTDVKPLIRSTPSFDREPEFEMFNPANSIALMTATPGDKWKRIQSGELERWLSQLAAVREVAYRKSGAKRMRSSASDGTSMAGIPLASASSSMSELHTTTVVLEQLRHEVMRLWSIIEFGAHVTLMQGDGRAARANITVCDMEFRIPDSPDESPPPQSVLSSSAGMSGTSAGFTGGTGALPSMQSFHPLRNLLAFNTPSARPASLQAQIASLLQGSGIGDPTLPTPYPSAQFIPALPSSASMTGLSTSGTGSGSSIGNDSRWLCIHFVSDSRLVAHERGYQVATESVRFTWRDGVASQQSASVVCTLGVKAASARPDALEVPDVHSGDCVFAAWGDLRRLKQALRTSLATSELFALLCFCVEQPTTSKWFRACLRSQPLFDPEYAE